MITDIHFYVKNYRIIRRSKVMRDNYSPTTGHEWFLGLQQRFYQQTKCYSRTTKLFQFAREYFTIKPKHKVQHKKKMKLYTEKQRPMSKSLARERHPYRRINFCRSIQSSALSMRWGLNSLIRDYSHQVYWLLRRISRHPTCMAEVI